MAKSKDGKGEWDKRREETILVITREVCVTGFLDNKERRKEKENIDLRGKKRSH